MFLVCGEALFDLFANDVAKPDRFALEACAGGSPFNVAIGISRLGGQSALLTGISDDLLGQRLISTLEHENVSTEFLVRSGRRTTLSLVGLDQAGHPDYVFYGLGSADCSLEPGDLPVLDTKITALHFGSYSLVVRPVADAFSTLLGLCGDRFVSVDPNVRLNVEPDLDIWRTRVREYAARANLLKISSEDLEALYPGVAFDTKAAEWISQGVDLVIVTDGGNKIAAWSKQGHQAMISPPKVDVADTVGAGDSFQAALLSKLEDLGSGNPLTAVNSLNVETLNDLLTYCAKAAAITCSRRGADLPNTKDLKSAD